MPYKPTPDEIHKSLDNIYYEIKQFVDMSSSIVFLLTAEHANHNNVIKSHKNAILESQLIHVRNLIDFFAVDSDGKDRVLAAHYGFSKRPINIVKKYKIRLNNDLAHLTYSRVKRTDIDAWWDYNSVITPTLERCFEFIKHILSTRKNFANIRRQNWEEMLTVIRNILDASQQKCGI